MTSGLSQSSTKQSAESEKTKKTARCAAKAKAKAKAKAQAKAKARAKAKQPASKATAKPKAAKGKPPVEPKEEPEELPDKDTEEKPPKVKRSKSDVENAQTGTAVRECLKRGKTSADVEANAKDKGTAAPAEEHEDDAMSEDSEAQLARKLKKQREAHAAYMRFSRSLKSLGLPLVRTAVSVPRWPAADPQSG